MLDRRGLGGLAVLLLVCFGAAAAGGLFTVQSLEDWYAALRKPSWNPPNWIFGPVWTLLYGSMAIAAWLVWRTGVAGVWAALGVFAGQLVLNVVWSGLFFGLRAPGAAAAEIAVLWAAIVATLLAFWRISPAAGWLLLPYLGWVTFASALNVSIWRLN